MTWRAIILALFFASFFTSTATFASATTEAALAVDPVAEKRLYRPPVKGITLLLWGGPIALMLLGLFVLQRYLRRRSTRINAEDQPLSAEESSRADTLLKELNPK